MFNYDQDRSMSRMDRIERVADLRKKEERRVARVAATHRRGVERACRATPGDRAKQFEDCHNGLRAKILFIEADPEDEVFVYDPLARCHTRSVFRD